MSRVTSALSEAIREYATSFESLAYHSPRSASDPPLQKEFRSF